MRIPHALASVGWNRKVLSSQDFERCCEEEEILVLTLPLVEWGGFYGVFDGVPVIALDESLRGVERDRVAWHELAHHFLHTPDFLFYDAVSEAKAQREANIIAACALIPLPLLKARTFAELEDDYGYPRDLISYRADLWRTRRI